MPSKLPIKEEDDFQIEFETCFFVVNEYLWTQKRPHQLRWHSVCYGFNPDTINKEDMTATTQKKREYYLMLDMNRLMFMASAQYSSKLFVQSQF